MRKPLALVAALLVLAPALAIAAPAEAVKIYWTTDKNGDDRARQAERQGGGPRFIAGAVTAPGRSGRRHVRLLGQRRGSAASNLNGGPWT